MKIIGYEKDGKFYGVATHLGMVYISKADINIYYSDEVLLKDFENAKKLVHGRPYTNDQHLKWKRDSDDEFRKYGKGRLFISELKNAKEFDIQPKGPSDNTKTVALRAQYKLTKKN